MFAPLLFALVVCTSFSFAVDSPSNEVYKFDPVQDSLLDAAMMVTPEPLAFEQSDSRFLADIRNAMVAGYSNYTSSSVLGLLNRILDKISSSTSGGYYSSIDRQYLDNINKALTGTPSQYAMNSVYDLLKKNLPLIDYLRLNNGILQKLYDVVNNDLSISLDSIESDASAIQSNSADLVSMLRQYISNSSSNNDKFLQYFLSAFVPAVWPEGFENKYNGYYFDIGVDGEFKTSGSFPFWRLMANSLAAITVDGYLGDQLGGSQRTLYGRVAQLQETLASDDDKALADAQKPNREQIEQDFVAGSSGGTSLGPQDFGDLSDVGGSIKDIAGLNGQASVGAFTDGLSQADKEGQGWFSASTRSALDAVTDYDAPVTYSLDPDPYNMEGFSSHYDWLSGGCY